VQILGTPAQVDDPLASKATIFPVFHAGTNATPLAIVGDRVAGYVPLCHRGAHVLGMPEQPAAPLASKASSPPVITGGFGFTHTMLYVSM
jgi:hypothetical protein